MNRMQEWLARAARELGVSVNIGYVAVLSNGRQLQAQARFPDFGGTCGTLVIDSDDVFDMHAERDLLDQGYCISIFSKPSANERFDLSGYAQMLSEWGWTGDTKVRPCWMS